MPKTKKIQYWNKSILVMVLLMFGIGLATISTTLQVTRIAEEYCCDVLHQSIKEMEAHTKDQVQNDPHQLTILTRSFSDYEDMSRFEIQTMPSSSESVLMWPRLESLDPDGIVQQPDGRWYESFENRTKQLNGEILNNKEAEVISKIGGNYLSFYVKPMDRFAISTRERIAFERTMQIRRRLYLLVLFETICFTAYFVWLIRNAKKEAGEKQKRLELVNYIYDVEKVLFSAYHNRNDLTLALQRVAKMSGAEAAFLKIFATAGADSIYLWCQKPEQQHALCTVLEKNRFYLETHDGSSSDFLLYDVQEWKDLKPDLYQTFWAAGLFRFAEVPVKDDQDHLVGMLGVINMNQRGGVRTVLENVTLSFGMFYRNIKLFERVKEMSEVDCLTGLLNRNCYQDNLDHYTNSQGKSVSCIYLDANGLHDVNNHCGHEAGDRMLQSIANRIRECFCEGDAYRIGGDEFVIFVTGETEDTVVRKVEHLKRKLSEKGYPISAGIQWAAAVDSRNTLDILIKKAELQMYAQKRNYYACIGKECRNRQKWVG